MILRGKAWAPLLAIEVLACGRTASGSGSGSGAQEKGWAFADQERLTSVQIQPRKPVPGETIRVQWEGSEGIDSGLHWGLAPSQDAGWQHYPRQAALEWASPRTQWWSVPDGAQRQVELKIPQTWQDRSVTLFAYRKQGEDMVPVRTGARLPSSDPPRKDAAKVAIAGVIELGPRPKRVAVPRAPKVVVVDGRDEDWPKGLESHALVDSLNGSAVKELGTQVRFMWDTQYLYVFASMKDPDLWAPHTQRDDPLYRKEALELFISADGSGADYLEIQISAANVIYDARFTRPRQGDRAYDGPWKHAVTRRGTLRRRRDVDEGWSAELALPWQELCTQARVHCPVMPGTQIRVNVFRLESPRRRSQEGTALSAVYRPDFHAMDRAAFLVLDP